MRRIKLIASILLLMAGSISLAEQQIATGSGPDYISVGLSNHGLQTVAEIVQQQSLPDIVGAPLENMKDRVSGFDVEVQDLKLWANFRDIRFESVGGFLRLNFNVRDVRIDARRIKAKKGWVKTTCKDTTLRIGRQRPARLHWELVPVVTGGQFRLQTRALAFNIPDDDYKVSGPRTCSGDLGAGWVTKHLVRWLLGRSRDQLQKAVVERIAATVPSFESTVASALDRQLVVFDPLGGDQEASIQLQPGLVSAAPGALEVRLNVVIESGPAEDATGSPEENLLGGNNQLIQLGHLGLTPSIGVRAFTALYPDGTPYMPIEVEDPDILTVDNLVSIWPDLLSLEPSSPELRIDLRMNQAPTLAHDPAGNRLNVAIDQFELRFQVQLAGQWQDYYHVTFPLDLWLQPAASADQIQLFLDRGELGQVNGRWGAGYEPRDGRFDDEVFVVVMQSLLDAAAGGGPLMTIADRRAQLGPVGVEFGVPTITAEDLRIGLYRR